MKARNGFVSNSSSSSFVILGKELKWNELKIEESNIWMWGMHVGEGSDIFNLTKEMLELIVGDSYFNRYSFYKAYKALYTEGGSYDVKRDELPESFNVFSWDKSYHSVESIETFQKRYINREN